MERSSASHRHFFASVHEAWRNLPEELTDKFPSSEHLRKYCLIKAGFCSSHTVVFDSATDAQRAGALARSMDPFSVLTVHERALTRYEADSQSSKTMNKDRFQASKDGVFRILEEMIGASRAQIETARAA